MKIHEFQAKDILRGYGLPLPEGQVAATADEAVSVAESLGGWPVVVKAQVHVGGRGKAGGVKLAANADETRTHAKAILGMSIKGSVVHRVLVERAVDIQREIYAGALVDRASKAIVIMVSAAGGVDIEEVAATNPERILKIRIEPALGLRDFQVRQAVYFLDIPREGIAEFGRVLATLEKIIVEHDASLVEVNPLVITSRNQVICADAKINLDDNALELHPELAALRDEAEEEPLEREARQHNLSYVKLEGR